jgi:hypothetical protein
MRKTIAVLAVMIAVFVLAVPAANAVGDKNQINHRYSYSNAFKHIYQWFRDVDGDGVMNCLDDDWVCPGSGDCDGVHDQIRIRLMKRDGSVAGDCYMYQNRKLRSGK